MRPAYKIVNFSITKVEDEQNVADALLRGDVVVADLSALPEQHYDLVVSFLEGVLFGINNQMIYLRSDLLLLLPDNVAYDASSVNLGGSVQDEAGVSFSML